MERQRAGVYTKEGLAAHHFDAPVLEIERIMGRDCFGFKDWFTIETISDREVEQGGCAGRWRWRD